MFLRENFSQRLGELRAATGMSQESLGKQFDVTKATISRMETGDRAVSVELLVALADYFNVSLDYLVGRSDDPERR